MNSHHYPERWCIFSHFQPEETEAYKHERQYRIVQGKQGAKGGGRESRVQTPAASVASGEALGMFLQISEPPFSPLHVYNHNSQFRELYTYYIRLK